MVDGGTPVGAPAVQALAVAGNAADASRLLALATRQPELAGLAVLAAGHLGDPAVGDVIVGLPADVPPELRARALRTIRGDSARSAPGGGRLLYGSPWSVEGLLARLVAPDELLRARPWYALEGFIRTGVPAAAALDRRSAAARQEQAAATIRSTLFEQARPVTAGNWLLWGRPAPQ
jgi:hypothetical protein